MKRRRITIGAPSTPEDEARLQDMLAARQCPGTMGTDRAFFQGRSNGESLGSMAPVNRMLAQREAKRAGVSLEGKQYISGLARRPNDPQAWVSDVSELKSLYHQRIAEGAQLNMRGIVNETCPVEIEPPKPKPLAQDIVNRLVNEQIRLEPEKARRRKQLEEDVRTKHTPEYSK